MRDFIDFAIESNECVTVFISRDRDKLKLWEVCPFSPTFFDIEAIDKYIHVRVPRVLFLPNKESDWYVSQRLRWS